MDQADNQLREARISHDRLAMELRAQSAAAPLNEARRALLKKNVESLEALSRESISLSAPRSGQVRDIFAAPNQYNPNPFFPVGNGFGLLLFFDRFEDTHFQNGIVKRPESKPRGPRKKKVT